MTPDERTCPSKKNEPLRYLCQKKIKLFDGINRLLDIPTPLHIPKVLHAQSKTESYPIQSGLASLFSQHAVYIAPS